MAAPAQKTATYDDLHRLPDTMVGEIIDGELHAVPRPSPAHAKVTSDLGAVITYSYRFGRGGPGGWIILDEPELRLGEHTLVPDIAGWKKERFPKAPDTNWISVPPDWVCEVLSPATVRLDKTRKMPIYADHGVAHIWLINPVDKTLEVFKSTAGGWLLLDTFAGNDTVTAEPFPAIGIDLADLWLA
jgi:Uma2 family endonuclease